jgi:hypothetical protein
MEALRAASPLSVGDITLVPIERAGIRSDRGDAGYWTSAFKEVFAVVVCDANGIRALDADSSEIALDALIRKTPNLGAILSKLSAS